MSYEVWITSGPNRAEIPTRSVKFGTNLEDPPSLSRPFPWYKVVSDRSICCVALAGL